jgi:YD repeat-containing protein
LTSDGTLSFEYDYRNQIVRVKQSTTTIAEYKYDALGRRVEKNDQSTVQRYIYSGSETVSVYDGSDNWVRDFAFGSRIDEVLMIEQADVLDYDGDQNTSETTRSFYHLGALGSVMEITDMNEAEWFPTATTPTGP